VTQSYPERAAPDPEELRNMDAYWRPPTIVGRPDLPVRQPLLKQPLTLTHVKHMLLGPGGPPWPEFLYTHLNRAIRNTT